MPPIAVRTVSAPRPSFAFARHFEETRVIQAAIASSAELGDRYFAELAQRWRVRPTETMVGHNYPTTKLLVPMRTHDDGDLQVEAVSVQLELSHIPTTQYEPRDRNALLSSCELVIVLTDVSSPNLAAINDVDQLARANPHCSVLVVNTFKHRGDHPGLASTQTQFERHPIDTRFLWLEQDSRLSILDLARHIESITLDLARRTPQTTAPAQGTGVEVSAQLMSALSNFDRSFTVNSTDVLSSSSQRLENVTSEVMDGAGEHIENVEHVAVKRKSRLRSALGR